MAANTKRLDLRFGSFACSVQGFDDPVMPVQQVLRAIQHLLEETPELADAGIQFDAEAVESLIEEVARRAELASEDVEITPGLVIVHRGENDFALRDLGEALGVDAESGAEPGGEAEPEAWSRPFSGATAPTEPAYVNIFGGAMAAGGAEAGPGDDTADSQEAEGTSDLATALAAAEETDEAIAAEPSPDAEDDIGDVIAARLRGLGDDEPGVPVRRDIFAEAEDDGGDDGSVFFDPATPSDARMAGPAQDDEADAPLNLFADSRAAGAGVAPGSSIFALDSSGDDDDDLLAGADAAAERAEAPTGDTGEQPDPEGEGDGYSVGGLAKAAGASSVDAMMVAAAAWMVLLRGQSNFSRREVMDVFEQIPGDHETSLEARIKGFGKAVRNGQIIMVQDGVFGLSRTEVDRFQALL